MSEAPRHGLLRSGRALGVVTNVELFFDLVYVFAVTQLSHLLATNHSVDGAVQAAVLLAVVWQVWVYTTWSTTYLDPNRQPVRLLLLALMLGSLVLAAALPHAFEYSGMLVAATFATMQVGRSGFMVAALRGEALQRTFQRALVWSCLSAAVMILGGLVDGHARELLWALAVGIELGGSAIGFHVPGLGRSGTGEWRIDGDHFAERCQAFVLIALGESIVVTGTTLSGIRHPGGSEITAFVTAFLASVGLWWIYFDRVAHDSARAIAESDDPGRLARSAFHWVHPLIVAGIIVAAAADELVLGDPAARGRMSTAWLVLGGVALYLGGHALFKAILWRVVSWPRLVAVAVLALLLVLAPHVTALTLGIAVLVVIIAVAVADRVQHLASPD